MNLESITEIELALSRVGDQLAFERQRLSVVVLGGAALNLLGLVSRATSDVDIIAFASETLNSSDHNLMPPPEPLPQVLKSAIAAVANDMGLGLSCDS